MTTLLTQLLRAMSEYQLTDMKKKNLQALLGMNVFFGLLLTGCGGSKGSSATLSEQLRAEIVALESNATVTVVEAIPDLSSHSIRIPLEVNDDNVVVDVSISSNPMEVSSASIYVLQSAESQMLTASMKSTLITIVNIAEQDSLSVEDLYHLIVMSPDIDVNNFLAELHALNNEIPGSLVDIFSEIVNKNLHTVDGCLKDDMLDALSGIVQHDALVKLLNTIGEENYISIMAMSDKDECKVDGGNFEENYLVNIMAAKLFDIDNVPTTINTIKNARPENQILLLQEFSELVLKAHVTASQRDGGEISFAGDIKSQTARVEFEVQQNDEYVYVESNGKTIQFKLADYIAENTGRMVNINFSGAVDYLQEGEDEKGIWEIVFVNKSGEVAEEEDFMGVLNEMVGFVYDADDGVVISVVDKDENDREVDLQVYSSSIVAGESGLMGVLKEYAISDLGSVSEADTVTGAGLALFVLQSMYHFADNIFDIAYQADYEASVVKHLTRAIDILTDKNTDKNMQIAFKKALGEYLNQNSESFGLDAAKVLVEHMVTLINIEDELLIDKLSAEAKFKIIEILTAYLDVQWPSGEKKITVKNTDDLVVSSLLIQSDYNAMEKREMSIDAQAMMEVQIKHDLDSDGTLETYYINIYNSHYNSDELVVIVDDEGVDQTQLFREKELIFTDSVLSPNHYDDDPNGRQYILLYVDDMIIEGYDSGSHYKLYLDSDVELISFSMLSPNIDGVMPTVRVNQYISSTLFNDNISAILKEIIDAATVGGSNYTPDEQLQTVLRLVEENIRSTSIDAGFSQGYNVDRQIGTTLGKIKENADEHHKGYIRDAIWEYIAVNYVDKSKYAFYILESYLGTGSLDVEDLRKYSELMKSNASVSNASVSKVMVELQMKITDVFESSDKEAIADFFYSMYKDISLDEANLSNHSWSEKTHVELVLSFTTLLHEFKSGLQYGQGVYSAINLIQFMEHIVGEYPVIGTFTSEKKMATVQAVLGEHVEAGKFDDMYRYDSVIFRELKSFIDNTLFHDKTHVDVSNLLMDSSYWLIENQDVKGLEVMLLFQAYYNKESDTPQASFLLEIQTSIVSLINKIKDSLPEGIEAYIDLLESLLSSYNNAGMALDYKAISAALGESYTLYQLHSSIDLNVLYLLWEIQMGDQLAPGETSVSIIPSESISLSTDFSAVKLTHNDDIYFSPEQAAASINSSDNHLLRLMEYKNGIGEPTGELLIFSNSIIENVEKNSTLYDTEMPLAFSWQAGQLFDSKFDLAEQMPADKSFLSPYIGSGISAKQFGLLELAAIADSYSAELDFFKTDASGVSYFSKYVQGKYSEEDQISQTSLQALEIAVRLHMSSFQSSDVDAVIGEVVVSDEMPIFLDSLTAGHNYLLPILLAKLQQQASFNLDATPYIHKSLELIHTLFDEVAAADPLSEEYSGIWSSYDGAILISKEILKLKQLPEYQDKHFVTGDMVRYLINTSLKEGSYNPEALITENSFDPSVFIYAMIRQYLTETNSKLRDDDQAILDSYLAVVQLYGITSVDTIHLLTFSLGSDDICNKLVAGMYRDFIIIDQQLENSAGFYNYTFGLLKEDPDIANMNIFQPAFMFSDLTAENKQAMAAKLAEEGDNLNLLAAAYLMNDMTVITGDDDTTLNPRQDGMSNSEEILALAPELALLLENVSEDDVSVWLQNEVATALFKSYEGQTLYFENLTIVYGTEYAHDETSITVTLSVVDESGLTDTELAGSLTLGDNKNTFVLDLGSISDLIPEEYESVGINVTLKDSYGDGWQDVSTFDVYLGDLEVLIVSIPPVWDGDESGIGTTSTDYTGDYFTWDNYVDLISIEAVALQLGLTEEISFTEAQTASSVIQVLISQDNYKSIFQTSEGQIIIPESYNSADSSEDVIKANNTYKFNEAVQSFDTLSIVDQVNLLSVIDSMAVNSVNWHLDELYQELVHGIVTGDMVIQESTVDVSDLNQDKLQQEVKKIIPNLDSANPFSFTSSGTDSIANKDAVTGLVMALRDVPLIQLYIDYLISVGELAGSDTIITDDSEFVSLTIIEMTEGNENGDLVTFSVDESLGVLLEFDSSLIIQEGELSILGSSGFSAVLLSEAISAHYDPGEAEFNKNVAHASSFVGEVLTNNLMMENRLIKVEANEVSDGPYVLSMDKFSIFVEAVLGNPTEEQQQFLAQYLPKILFELQTSYLFDEISIEELALSLLTLYYSSPVPVDLKSPFVDSMMVSVMSNFSDLSFSLQNAIMEVYSSDSSWVTLAVEQYTKSDSFYENPAQIINQVVNMLIDNGNIDQLKLVIPTVLNSLYNGYIETDDVSKKYALIEVAVNLVGGGYKYNDIDENQQLLILSREVGMFKWEGQKGIYDLLELIFNPDSDEYILKEGSAFYEAFHNLIFTDIIDLQYAVSHYDNSQPHYFEDPFFDSLINLAEMNALIDILYLLQTASIYTMGEQKGYDNGLASNFIKDFLLDDRAILKCSNESNERCLGDHLDRFSYLFDLTLMEELDFIYNGGVEASFIPQVQNGIYGSPLLYDKAMTSKIIEVVNDLNDEGGDAGQMENALGALIAKDPYLDVRLVLGSVFADDYQVCLVVDKSFISALIDGLSVDLLSLDTNLYRSMYNFIFYNYNNHLDLSSKIDLYTQVFFSHKTGDLTLGQYMLTFFKGSLNDGEVVNVKKYIDIYYDMMSHTQPKENPLLDQMISNHNRMDPLLLQDSDTAFFENYATFGEDSLIYHVVDEIKNGNISKAIKLELLSYLQSYGIYEVSIGDAEDDDFSSAYLSSLVRNVDNLTTECQIFLAKAIHDHKDSFSDVNIPSVFSDVLSLSAEEVLALSTPALVAALSLIDQEGPGDHYATLISDQTLYAHMVAVWMGGVNTEYISPVVMSSSPLTDSGLVEKTVVFPGAYQEGSVKIVSYENDSPIIEILHPYLSNTRETLLIQILDAEALQTESTPHYFFNAFDFILGHEELVHVAKQNLYSGYWDVNPHIMDTNLAAETLDSLMLMALSQPDGIDYAWQLLEGLPHLYNSASPSMSVEALAAGFNGYIWYINSETDSDIELIHHISLPLWSWCDIIVQNTENRDQYSGLTDEAQKFMLDMLFMSYELEFSDSSVWPYIEGMDVEVTQYLYESLFYDLSKLQHDFRITAETIESYLTAYKQENGHEWYQPDLTFSTSTQNYDGEIFTIQDVSFETALFSDEYGLNAFSPVVTLDITSPADGVTIVSNGATFSNVNEEAPATVFLSATKLVDGHAEPIIDSLEAITYLDNMEIDGRYHENIYFINIHNNEVKTSFTPNDSGIIGLGVDYNKVVLINSDTSYDEENILVVPFEDEAEKGFKFEFNFEIEFTASESSYAHGFSVAIGNFDIAQAYGLSLYSLPTYSYQSDSNTFSLRVDMEDSLVELLAPGGVVVDTKEIPNFSGSDETVTGHMMISWAPSDGLSYSITGGVQNANETIDAKAKNIDVSWVPGEVNQIAIAARDGYVKHTDASAIDTYQVSDLALTYYNDYAGDYDHLLVVSGVDVSLTLDFSGSDPALVSLSSTGALYEFKELFVVSGEVKDSILLGAEGYDLSAYIHESSVLEEDSTAVYNHTFSNGELEVVINATAADVNEVLSVGDTINSVSLQLDEAIVFDQIQIEPQSDNWDFVDSIDVF